MQLPAGTTLQTKVESGRNKAEVILKEASKGYDLIVLGATEQNRSNGSLFNLLVDRVVQDASCATMVVKSHLPQPKGEFCAIAQQKLEHILVPTVGTQDSKNAVEVASTIAAQTGALVTLVNVILSMNVSGGDSSAYASAVVLMMMLLLTNGAAIWMGEHWLHSRIQD